jgi:hypothetical protein
MTDIHNNGATRNTRLQPRISRLTIRNLRSIVDQTVELKPLTVLVGGNSSGKSTLHSVLRLFAQAQALGVVDNSFPLNGPLISMGDFEELLHAGRSVDKQTSMTIGMSFELPQQQIQELEEDSADALEGSNSERNQISASRRQRQRGAGQARLDAWLSSDSTTSSFSRIDVEIDLKQSNDAGHSGATIAGARATLVSAQDAGKPVQIVIASGPNEIREQTDGGFDADSDESSISFHGGIEGLIDGDEKIAIGGVTFRAGIPISVHEKSDIANVVLNDVRQSLLFHQLRSSRISRLSSGMKRNRSDSADQFKDENFVLALKDRIFQGLLQMDPQRALQLCARSGDQIGRSRLSQRLDIPRLPDDWAFQIGDFFDENLDSLLAELHRSDDLWKSHAGMPIPELNLEIANDLARYLQRRISFLDGIRYQGAEIQSYGMVGTRGDIGTSGEYLTSVLFQERNRRIFQCPGFESQRGVTLGEAVDHWIAQFEFGQSINVKEQPGYGYRKEIVPIGLQKAVSLRAVGRGVDHAIPVVVRVLMARPGDLVILEQPEIHLHPNAQLKMADFIVSAVKTGRNIIVETHSELFALRIRRLVATASEGDREILKSLIGFVFAERNSKTAVSTYRNVELSEDGGFEEWPSGFFDQQEEDSLAILKANLRSE